MPSRPRLLVLTTTFPRWDHDHEPAFVYQLSKRLADAFDVTVVAPHFRGANTVESMAGMEIHRFRYAPERLETLAYAGGIGNNLRRHKWKYLLLQGFLLSFFFTALSLVRSKKIDVIHAHWLIPGGMIGAALKILFPNLRIVATAHGADVFSLRGRLFARVRRWVVEEVDAVTVVGGSLAERAHQEGWHIDTVSIAPMGVELQDTFVPKPHPHEHPTLVFAGRLVEKKGIQHLIEAMPLIRQSVPDIRLLVAGHGPLREALERRVVELKLSVVVTFLGEYTTQELASIFAQSDIAVLPFVRALDGDEEGFGLTTVEAMGCALPVVVGDVPAIRDFVEHGKNGVIVTGETAEDLAQAVSETWHDPTGRDRMRQFARKTVLARFDWPIVAARYEQLMQTLQ